MYIDVAVMKHGCLGYSRSRAHCTAAFTYNYDPVIWRNKLIPLSIFRDLALRKRDSKKFMFYFYVFYRVCILTFKNDMGW